MLWFKDRLSTDFAEPFVACVVVKRSFIGSQFGRSLTFADI